MHRNIYEIYINLVKHFIKLVSDSPNYTQGSKLEKNVGPGTLFKENLKMGIKSFKILGKMDQFKFLP